MRNGYDNFNEKKSEGRMITCFSKNKVTTTLRSGSDFNYTRQNFIPKSGTKYIFLLTKKGCFLVKLVCRDQSRPYKVLGI